MRGVCECVRVYVCMCVRVCGEGEGREGGRKGRGKEGVRGVCVCVYVCMYMCGGRGREGVKEGRREV